MTLVALSLASALFLQAPPPSTHRVAVILVPMDHGAESSTLKLETYMTEALDGSPNLTVKTTDALLGLPADDEAETSLKRAEQGFKESAIAFDAHSLEDAERKLHSTLKEFQKAAGSLKACGHYCDGIAMYASTLLTRGDSEEAKLNLLDLIALAPNYEYDSKRFGRDFLAFRTQVATSHSASMRGNAVIKSKPNGARVFLDGEFSGYTPVTLSTLSVGKHLVRLERPGFTVHGETVDVTPEDAELKMELHPSSAYRAYDGQLDKVAAEVAHDKGGSALASLGKSFGIDHAIVGTVKEVSESGALEVNLGYFELATGKKVSGKKAVFQGDEFGQLKSELGRFVNHLINSANGQNEKVVRTSDPLENRHGTEDWNGDEKRPAEKSKKKGDPLDGMSGTQDW